MLYTNTKFEDQINDLNVMMSLVKLTNVKFVMMVIIYQKMKNITKLNVNNAKLKDVVFALEI